MAIAHNLGFPRIGANRELKTLLESYWKREIDEKALLGGAGVLRRSNWERQSGLDLVPAGDFSLYDHMLDMTCLLGAVPERFRGQTPLETYFSMARGKDGVAAMEMTKWFDTNYHYIVPEFVKATAFGLDAERLFEEVAEAMALGLSPKPVLVGPITYLYLGKEKEEGFDRIALVEKLIPVYLEILERLARMGVEWVQIDEPALALDLPRNWLSLFDSVYSEFASSGIGILLATYFGPVSVHAEMLMSLPVAGLHIDLCRGRDQLPEFLENYPPDKVLSLGVIDGRNIWRADLEDAFSVLRRAGERLKERLWIAPSCSLLHCPVDLEGETAMDREIRGWLAFSAQKLKELAILKKGLEEGGSAIRGALESSFLALSERRNSSRVHHPVVQERLERLKPSDGKRASHFEERSRIQKARFALPAFPTTTIGSFPQTEKIRKVRADFRNRKIGFLGYLEAMRSEIRHVVEKQESLGLDVLVHGEPERNDMVEYFGEHLLGYAFTENGWVQSYGSRCVKPPIIYGDVMRQEAITVEWSKYAQSLTEKPMKGMLTGPVTMLQWSFVRDDQPRSRTALQLAMAIREEVMDLEKAGIGIIQIDEPAIREGLPLRKSDWREYLEWAVRAFRISSSGVGDGTQIHTHMCYAEFNDILPAIAELDADVITIETSRSDMELLKGFGKFEYPNGIGPGVYDIHSPRIPEAGEMVRLLEKACAVIDPWKIWVNPDCGLKTRGWPEVEEALGRMVEAARQLRENMA